jgi:single-strand DNA-binding protein
MINKVILVGNVGRDPELRYTASGTAVANFSLATSRRYKDRDGNQQEQTEWHRCVAWARTAEIVNQYANKGKQLYIEGRLQTRQWEDRDGKTRYTTEVVADNIQLLGRAGGGGSSGGDYGDPGPAGGPGGDRGESGDAGGGGSAPVNDDDIPF